MPANDDKDDWGLEETTDEEILGDLAWLALELAKHAGETQHVSRLDRRLLSEAVRQIAVIRDTLPVSTETLSDESL